ncbi:Mitochondrial inner membrane protein oxa1 [Tulasnella sp. JGI-2019a]|nr:Mitochondrial inner membrane protein oxa1 [Tulasnella sp. JGI-2019a]
MLPRTASLARFTASSNARANLAARAPGNTRLLSVLLNRTHSPATLRTTSLLYATRSFGSSPTPTPTPVTPPTPSGVSVESAAAPSLPGPSVPPPQPLYTSEAASATPVDAIPPIDGSIADLITTPLANGDHIGDLSSLGLGGWSPAGIVQTILEQIHVTTGLPWWASILTLAAVVRIASLPLHIRVVANNSRMAYATKRVKAATEKIKESQATGDKMALMKASMEMRQAYTDAGASPLVGLLGLVQMPIGIAMFFGIKWMCNLPVESMKTGGLAWFTDLTMSDPTYVLPIVSTAAFVAMLKLASAETPKAQETKHMTNGFTLLSLLGLPIMAQLPTGLMLYFVSNGALMGVQAAILRIPAVKQWANIRPAPPTSEIIPAPTMKETLLAGYNKFKSLNEQRFEQIAANAVAKANKDMKEREEEARKAGRQTPTTAMAQRRGVKSKAR